ncbi:MAG: OmpH family outer membrane protein [Gammaproteobacteria bacterium]|nr:OmpH family outer membrane protein [Gammaproteobacteria bacterium]MBU6510082.1 OmpH family outer membrane protein [Gammaproteobacteria bacterium]MDE1984596.1 OmpH family outer membrane protein [Gammaproteobacteria bacterium]MDE2109133.1 OmpH family outer membrane protein [Gammaproteobacteria bacterium]MDE2459790.1 OmpH family outer membrane protein [Gammaproteobacteria bacterium]
MTRYGFIAAAVLAAGLLAATTVQAAEQPRIGVVNLQEVIAKSQAGQQANQELQSIVKKLQDQANDKNNKLNVLKQQLDKADPKSSSYAQLQKTYDDSRNDLQQFVLMGRQDLDQRRQELLQPIEQDLGKVLDQYAKAHHYDIILSKDTAGALYASDKYDVSQGVAAALDKDWPAYQKQLQQQKSAAPAAKSGS